MKLFGHTKHGAEPGMPEKVCKHVTLAPHWDRAQDMGHNDLAIAFVCDTCHRQFTPAEAREIMANR